MSLPGSTHTPSILGTTPRIVRFIVVVQLRLRGKLASQEMRNVVTEASLGTRANQWWTAIPCVTAGVVGVCSAIYVISLVFGFDDFSPVCLSPDLLVGHGGLSSGFLQVLQNLYRPYSSVVFHTTIIHLVFNMLALVQIGTGLEYLLGSLRYLHVLILMATSNALLQVVISLIVAYNPIHPYLTLMYECAIGFSGVIFAMIVIETSLNSVQTRSIFGFFNIPAKWYPWALLVLFQLLIPRASLLGHLSGILSGFLYTYGAFHYLMLSPSKYGAIEGLSFLAPLVRRPGFIEGGSAGTTPLALPSFSMPVGGSGSLAVGRAMSRLQAWIPQTSQEPTAATDPRFPGQGHVLGSSTASRPRPAKVPSPSANRRLNPSSNQSELQARLLDSASPVSPPEVPHHAPTTPPHTRSASQPLSNN